MATKMQGDLRELEAAAESAAKTYDNFRRMPRYMEAMQRQSLLVFSTMSGGFQDWPWSVSFPGG